MKKQFARAALAAALLCGTAGAAAVLTASPAMAEQHVSRAVGEALNDAIKAAQAGDYPTAAAALQKADAVTDKSDFDKMKIDQIKGFVAIGQKDYAAATTAYEGIVASPAFSTLDKKEQQQTLHNAALLSAQAKHWPQVIFETNALEKFGPLDDKAYAVLAQAYYFTNDYANAKTAAEKSVAAAKAAGIEPQQAALEIIMSAQAKSNDQAGAMKTLEMLAANYGGASDWGQLIDHGLGTKGITELDALYLYRLRLATGAEAAAEDYTIAAGIAIHQGYPAEAQNILEKGLSTGKLSHSGKVSALLRKAREGVRVDKGSLGAIAKAAHRSKYGEQLIKLAEDYYGYGRYDDAAAAAQAGIAKGHLKDASEGHFILAISLIGQGKIAEGQAELAKVDGSPARAKAAHLWDLYAQYKTKQAAKAAAPAAAPKQ